ncbi:MAG: Xaa-Pro peptidase family protein [Enterococcaceae bacterium]|nr:Xaa-Pro peptidase family protein [Enterococcaceae bacterium]MCI1918896.1 Xaa-Pro peptidase family protein [Enterococcaceae bacterium]
MSKLKKVQERMIADGYDALVICDGADIKYLTGFSGEYGVSTVVISKDKFYLITDGRFEFQAKEEVPECEVLIMNGQQRDYYVATGDLLKELNVKAVLIQTDKIFHRDYLSVKNSCESAELRAAPPYIEELRQVKTSEEITLIREACRISERSFYALLDFIKPGVTEIDIANELEYQFRSRGGSGFCFETIVASGPINGANCHATPSDRKIEAGDFITLDFGTAYKGYCSDMTRTVAVGRPHNEEMLKIYETVKVAKKAGAAILQAGLPIAEVDQTIRKIIGEAGYTVPHGLGHSFGLYIHEDPFISAKNPNKFKKNAITTIEPGIYVPGVCGVRIEDDYLIGESSAERLQQSTNELIIL